MRIRVILAAAATALLAACTSPTAPATTDASRLPGSAVFGGTGTIGSGL